MSSDSANPSTKFGGTWEQITDRMIMAAGSTYAAGTTGGSDTHTHTTAEHTLTIEQIPSHTHYTNALGVGSSYMTTSSSGYVVLRTPALSDQYADTNTEYRRVEYTGGSASHNHGNTGSSSNLPPYIVAYIWRRTA